MKYYLIYKVLFEIRNLSNLQYSHRSDDTARSEIEIESRADSEGNEETLQSATPCKYSAIIYCNTSNIIK